MKLDLTSPLELTKIIGRILLDDLASLLLHLVAGILIGVVLVYFIYRLFKAKGWSRRPIQSSTKRILFHGSRVIFYLAIIGLSAVTSLIIGSQQIIKKEVALAVDKGIEYYNVHYFDDFKFIEEVFAFSGQVYAKGGELNKINHHIAEGIVDQISEKHGLGFLGSYILHNPKNDMIQQMEDLERGMLILFLSKSLEQIGAGDVIEPDKLDKAFYAWLHADSEANLGTINTFVSAQITEQLNPLVLSIWLPFLMVNLLVILIYLTELVVFLYRQDKQPNSAVLLNQDEQSIKEKNNTPVN